MCNKLFDTLFQPILLYGSEIWGAYDSINLKKWEKDPVERLHTQFYKILPRPQQKSTKYCRSKRNRTVVIKI